MSSFGRRVLQNPSVASLLDLERQENQSKSFAELDSLVTDVTIRSLQGERILTMRQNKVYENAIAIEGLNAGQRELLESTFGLAEQQAKGAWFVPDKVTLPGGIANFPFYLAGGYRFPHSISSLEQGKVILKSSADAVFLWAVLCPLFDELLYPFELRAQLAGTLPRREEQAAWKQVSLFLNDLGFTPVEELAALRGGWKAVDSQLLAKRTLLESLSRTADDFLGARCRLRAVLPLVEQYYQKAKSDGRAKRKQVLTKPFQKALSGFFRGDWLGLLKYLGEEPHSDEQIVTALPQIPLRVGGVSRAEEIAAKQGISTEEVKRIAAVLWQESAGASPVEARVHTLKRFWQFFDDIHGRQESGMRPLWGLVEEIGSTAFDDDFESPYQAGLYRALLPNDLRHEIESLWGNVMLPKWPDRIVTEPFPYRLMAETFGTALFFWQSCSLTAWFICEGPYSRTDLAGLAHHQRRELHNLKEMQTPVDETLFEDLTKAEHRLGPEEPITRESSTVGVGFDTPTMSISTGSRRKGFEILRDIIDHHRRDWANHYLDYYLRLRWESEIRDAAKAFNLKMLEKEGKPPTLKQFARSAALVTNHWFKGDVSGFYRAIGEKAPVQPAPSSLMPADKFGFVRRVLERLPSRQFELDEGRMLDERTQDRYRKEIASLAIIYIQLNEALGHAPEMKEMGEKFAYRSKVLDEDESEAWRIFSNAVQAAFVECEEPRSDAHPK
jgi:hypothetical protein